MPRAIQWSFLRRPDLGKGFWNKRESQAELEEKCKKIVRGMLVRGCRVRFNENGGLLLSILLSPFYVFRILQLLCYAYFDFRTLCPISAGQLLDELRVNKTRCFFCL